MLTINNIICPVDFSEVSNNAVSYAAELARNSNAAIVLLTVLPENYTNAYGVYEMVLDMKSEMKKEAEANIAKLSARLKEESGKSNIIGSVVEGDAADSIIDAAKKHNADLIVMGSHGRKGLGRLLMGSVAEVVFRNAPCPVMIIKANSDNRII
jgi:universal stress protein A